MLTRVLAALGKTLVSALLADFLRFSCWGVGVGGGGGDKIVMHIASMPKKTGIYSVFASLYNMLHKDVEQEHLSHASMPFATKSVLSVLDVSAQPQSPKLEPPQARCTLNAPAPQKNMQNAENIGGHGTFQHKTTLQLHRSTLNAKPENAPKSQKHIPKIHAAKSCVG